MTPSPDDDFLVCMGLESCWVTPPAAEALEDAGLVEYGLFQDAESGVPSDGLVLTDGTSPEDVWAWIGENGSGHDEAQ